MTIFDLFRNNSRVQPEKSYDARPGAPNPDSEEIYIPPSEVGSTCKFCLLSVIPTFKENFVNFRIIVSYGNFCDKVY